MSSGKTHDKVNGHVLYGVMTIASVLFVYSTFGSERAFSLLLIIAGFYIGTYYVGPDLDTRSLPYSRWGKIKWIWKPYQKWFSHRSVWTHGFVIGDLIRLVYIMVCLLPFYSMAIVLFNFNAKQTNYAIWTHILDYHTYYGSFIIGMIFASSVHIITDHLYSARKRRRNRRKKKKRK